MSKIRLAALLIGAMAASASAQNQQSTPAESLLPSESETIKIAK